MEVGFRVVRGPDWMWGDQDGGEGFVGTVVRVGGAGDLADGTVLVYWDTGKQANYRVGHSGKYDLRVYDSAPTGLKHTHITCDGCRQCPLVGTRWKCCDCNNYDLCSTCYMGDIHDREHSFHRYDASGGQAIPVGKRSESTKLQAKGLFPGAKVQRGRDWKWADQDGGSGRQGTLNEITLWESVARAGAKVSWNLFRGNTYRIGYQGAVDLKCVTPATGASYYRESLAKLGEIQQPKETGLKVGDRVKVCLDPELLKAMAQGHGGWHDGMAACIDKVGQVEAIDGDGDVHIRYGLLKWVFHPGAVTKLGELADFRTGNRVKVMEDKQLVQQLQQGHGGWNESMNAALGKEGRVVEVDTDGDVVAMFGTQIWLFNPAVLQLLSTGEGDTHRGDTSPAEGLEDLVRLLLLGAALKSGDVGDRIVNAASTGNLQEVRQLLEANPDKVDHKRGGKTALHVACHQGRTDIVQYMLSKNANRDIKDEQEYTALHHAAYGDRTGETVTLMLNSGTNVNVNSNKNKSTPLHLAVNQGNEAGVRALLRSQHCNLNCQDLAGDTALHDAISKDKNNIVDVLLGSSLDKLDVTVCNGRGFNPLHLACMKGNKHAVAKMADKCPGLIEVPKEDGFTALHLAAFNNNTDIARTLLLSGHCDINMRNHKRQTALALAVSEAYTATIELLVEHGADVNAEDEDGDTPLHLAVIHQAVGTTGLRRLFQELGVNLPGGDSDQNTGSAIACYLALHGADINYMNHDGKAPLDLCPDPQTAANIQQFSRTTTRRSTHSQPRPQEMLSTSAPRRTAPPPPVAARGPGTTSAPRASAAATSQLQKKSRDLVNRADTTASDCIICCENTAAVKFHPCGHMISCTGCSVKLKRCLACNAVIQQKTTTEGAAINAPTMMDTSDYDERLRSMQDRLRVMEDATQCQICMERDRSVVFLCGHNACRQCSDRLNICHVCRKPIQNRIPLYN